MEREVVMRAVSLFSFFFLLLFSFFLPSVSMEI